jgi:hypothetical protein
MLRFRTSSTWTWLALKLLNSYLAARRQTLTYVNASSTTSLCQSGCFHTTLTDMSSLRVLDMSHMGLDSASTLNALRTLTSLQELYLNNNNRIVSLTKCYHSRNCEWATIRCRQLYRQQSATTLLPPTRMCPWAWHLKLPALQHLQR